MFIAYQRKWRAAQYHRRHALIRAARVSGVQVIWEVAPHARIVHPDPVIHVHADLTRPDDVVIAQGYSRSKFEAWEMISGRLCPEFGGQPKYPDIIGVNYYPQNQWIVCGEPFSPSLGLPRSHAMYRPFAMSVGKSLPPCAPGCR